MVDALLCWIILRINLTASHYSYQWGCQVLEEENISCFNQSSADQIPSLNSSSLQFPATMLRMDRKYFLFNLTVHSPGSHPGNSTQVIELNNINHIIP